MMTLTKDAEGVKEKGVNASVMLTRENGRRKYIESDQCDTKKL